MNYKLLQPLIVLLAVFLVNACNSKGTAKIGLGAADLPVPDAPSLLVLTTPSTATSFLPNPIITVSGVSSSDIVRLYTDSDCTVSASAETVSAGASVAVTASTLPVGAHTLFANTKNSYNITSTCSSVSVAYTRTLCPTDYIEVPGAGGVSTYCIMKYEAKCEDAMGVNCAPATGAPGVNKIAASKPTGLPWVTISQSDADVACTNLNAIHGLTNKFDLISNPEWMVAAELIEAEDDNWDSLTAGTGSINRGHTDITPNGICDAALDNVGATCATPDATPIQKRTHILNGQLIWDFAGNAWDWVDWGLTTGLPITSSPTCPLGYSELHEVVVNCPALAPADYLNSFAIGDVASNTGLGQIYGGSTGTTARGGRYNYGVTSGIYALLLSNGAAGDTSTGFRCVYRP